MKKLQVPMQHDRFGFKFLSPVRNEYGKRGWHPGVDFNYGKGFADYNLPIKAMHHGKVVHDRAAGGGWGNLIVIYHSVPGTSLRVLPLDVVIIL